MKRILSLILLLIALPSLATAQQIPVTRCVSATPTADTSAYASGDLIGGKLTFTGALGDYTATGYVVSVRITDLAAQASDLDLVLFTQNPTNTTFTDQAAFDVADTDLAKALVPINLGSASRFAFNDNSIHYVGHLFEPLYGVTSGGALSTTIYGALISRGSPTFATAADVTVTICVSQDSQ